MTFLAGQTVYQGDLRKIDAKFTLSLRTIVQEDGMI
jgi:hypothetical protein